MRPPVEWRDAVDQCYGLALPDSVAPERDQPPLISVADRLPPTGVSGR